MGSVWAARNEQLGMLVALKFIELSDGADLEDARTRFEREARAAARIRSPHVAQVFEHVATGDRPFIAMELLEGEDLGDRLRREKRLSVPAIAKILTQASKALRRAHESGIIHRDLKPGNIFLARFDDDEVVKILDFGVAKMRVEGGIDGPLATQTGVVFGSPTYMSPEQARGVRSLDHRSDLWSMAVIVFRAITGVKPFQAASIGDLVVKLCIDPLPVPTAFAPDLPPGIDAFFVRAFARDPEGRFQSAVDMAAALEAVAAGSTAMGAQATPYPGAPASIRPVPPPASAPGSGPHVAFAPGTLTPPPGAAHGIEQSPGSRPFDQVAPGSHPSLHAIATPLPRAPSFHEVTAPSALHQPAASTPIPASIPGTYPGDPIAGIPNNFNGLLPSTQSPSRALAIAAGVGIGALALVVVMIALAAAKGGPAPAAQAISTSSASAPPAVEPPAPPATITPVPSAEPAASAEPVASAEPAASASAEPAASASAEPDASASADPAPPSFPKRPKKRPNFGY